MVTSGNPSAGIDWTATINAALGTVSAADVVVKNLQLGSDVAGQLGRAAARSANDKADAVTAGACAGTGVGAAIGGGAGLLAGGLLALATGPLAIPAIVGVGAGLGATGGGVRGAFSANAQYNIDMFKEACSEYYRAQKAAEGELEQLRGKCEQLQAEASMEVERLPREYAGWGALWGAGAGAGLSVAAWWLLPDAGRPLAHYFVPPVAAAAAGGATGAYLGKGLGSSRVETRFRPVRQELDRQAGCIVTRLGKDRKALQDKYPQYLVREG